MQLASKSTSRKLFVGILSFNIPVIVYVWTWTLQAHEGGETPGECLDLNTRLQELKFPLLCMFTTFKPSIAKIPVSQQTYVFMYSVGQKVNPIFFIVMLLKNIFLNIHEQEYDILYTAFAVICVNIL